MKKFRFYYELKINYLEAMLTSCQMELFVFDPEGRIIKPHFQIKNYENKYFWTWLRGMRESWVPCKEWTSDSWR